MRSPLLALALVVLAGCGGPTRLSALREAGFRARGPASDGWFRIEAAAGEYAFMIPGVPEVRRGRSITTFELLQEADSRGYLVYVWRVRRPAAAGVALDVIEEALLAMSGGEVSQRTEGSYLGHPVRDLRIDDVTRNGHVAFARLVDAGRFNVALVRIHLPEFGGDIGAELERLRASLRIAPEPVPVPRRNGVLAED